jgi:hypothetical protein
MEIYHFWDGKWIANGWKVMVFASDLSSLSKCQTLIAKKCYLLGTTQIVMSFPTKLAPPQRSTADGFSMV